MSELRDLYQEVILDHSKRPRNFRTMADPDSRAEGYNPLCGDRETVFVDMDGDVVKDVSFQGAGCAISTASASMMTESVKGRTRAEPMIRSPGTSERTFVPCRRTSSSCAAIASRPSAVT